MLERVDLGEGIRTQMAESYKKINVKVSVTWDYWAVWVCYWFILVLVAQFESWLSPFVIMFSVPFAATGAF